MCYKDSIKLYQEEYIRLNDLNKSFSNTNLNFYNYSIVNGIRNAISHGNVSCNNILTSELKDVEISFIDLYEDDIKFKLDIKLNNLFSLIEEQNLSCTNDFFIKRKVKIKK